ncbi:MAG TPA: hypothetical protein DD727_08475 [Clostridiales bacterium]|nr:hypothetical protein [Clostridiales bacterium]
MTELRDAMQKKAPEKRRHPNIIFYILDDQGIGDVPTAPHDSPNYLPNLKRLAQRGITCTRAYANSPMCAPARASIMIGGYPQKIGVYELHDPAPGIPENVRIAPQYFKEEGYATGLIGKWHLGGQLDLLDGTGHKALIPQNKGFDTSFYFFGSTHDYWDPNLGNSELEVKGYPFYSPIYDNGTPVNKMEYLTHEISRRAVQFVEENKDRPFFLTLTHHVCHVPLQVPKSYHEHYEDLGIGELAMVSRAMYEACDDGLGLLLDKLADLNLDNDTIIIHTSDNGGGAPSGPTVWDYSGAKFYFGEAGLRIPFIISWPGHLPENRLYDDFVMQMDMLPTVLDAAGMKGPGREGISLMPYFMGEARDMSRREFYWSNGHIDTFAVMKDGYKLRMDRYCPGALHYIPDDPFEIRDLSAQHPEKVEELFSDYQTWMASNQQSLFLQDPAYALREQAFLEKIREDPLWQPKKTTPKFGPETPA